MVKSENKDISIFNNVSLFDEKLSDKIENIEKGFRFFKSYKFSEINQRFKDLDIAILDNLEYSISIKTITENVEQN